MPTRAGEARPPGVLGLKGIPRRPTRIVSADTRKPRRRGARRYPCRQPLHLPEWFDDPSTPKNIAFNMTLAALDDVIFKVEFHILHGMWLSAKEFFRNTATVQVHKEAASEHHNASSDAPPSKRRS